MCEFGTDACSNAARASHLSHVARTDQPELVNLCYEERTAGNQEDNRSFSLKGTRHFSFKNCLGAENTESG